MEVKRGEVYFADLNPVIGSEQGGVRPVVVLQNDIGNKYSPTVVAAITSRIKKTNMPTHVVVSQSESGMPKNSVIMLEQIRTIDKCRLRECIGRLDNKTMAEVNNAFLISVGLNT